MFSSKCWSWKRPLRMSLWLNLPLVSMMSRSMWLFVRPGKRILRDEDGQSDNEENRSEKTTHLPVYSSYSVQATDQTSSE